MAEKDTAAPRRRRLGQQLRRLREATGKTGAQVAGPLGWSAAKVSRIETAQTMPSEADITALVSAYGADDTTLGHVLKLRQDAAQKGWWEPYSESMPQGFVSYLGLEADAEEMRNWEPMVLPGLLQTPAYARTLMGQHMQPIAPIPKTWLNDRVEVRERRQEILLHGPKPLRLRVVFEESLLRRDVGGAEVMSEQLEKLVVVSEFDHVEIRVISTSTPLPVTTGPFVHFTFPDFPDIVYLEDLEGSRFLEDAEEVFRYERAFDHLMGVALDAAASRRAIKDAAAFWHG
ncbi:helix-turn-helix transcriptional regulator [Herbidospora sp. NBRC 101105]|uniref:helix-turn-helix domain-containing protein n=1 Tax=Herbidospora sp. NBRC 101105 TaxID=3032195 RepID=UPI0024A15423|nr:helix-turn-helix transcriptional regulator [Herbidospora sp. NBRC 101105]GLX96291.1 transcriptional regulator [Herbidospora sp. NBRC 101105]